MTQNDSPQYLEIARELADRVETIADRIDTDRQIPSEMAAELADNGLFRLLVPRTLGGAELSYPVFLRILDVFAKVDASTAWCMAQSNVFALESARMPENLAREIWEEQRTVVANGPPAQSVITVPVDGGFRLSGRWNFSSGSSHATWFAALTPVENEGRAEHASVYEGARMMMLPRKDVKFLDVWQVNGLRGTGSFSFEVDGLFVPRSRTYVVGSPSREGGPLYVIHPVLLFGASFATIALGVARASLKIAIELAAAKTPTLDKALLQNQSNTQRLIGEAEAIWRSGRAFLHESTSSVWESACENSTVDLGERINLRLAIPHAIRMAAQVVDIAYNICGSDAIFEANPIQRRFQDVHVITQHLQARSAHYETAGQYLLGLDPQGSF